MDETSSVHPPGQTLRMTQCNTLFSCHAVPPSPPPPLSPPTHPGHSSTLAALWTCSQVDTATVLPAPCWRRLSSVACLGALTPEVLRSVRQGVLIYPLAEGSWVVGSLLMPYCEHPRSVACRRYHGFFFLFSLSSPLPPLSLSNYASHLHRPIGISTQF